MNKKKRERVKGEKKVRWKVMEKEKGQIVKANVKERCKIKEKRKKKNNKTKLLKTK
jgi:hypothetical protein